MRIDVLTLFPGMVEPVVAASILGRARSRGLVDIRVVDLRDYAAGRHRTADDYQFGGGGGMVLKPEPIFAAVEAVRTEGARVVLMDPRGRTLTQALAQALAKERHLILIAGRYEGVDERVRDDVAVGVPGEPPRLVRELDAAEHERNALGEGVSVHPDPDPDAHGSLSCRRTRRSKTETVS